jgi:hypothetical protein
LTSFVVNVCGLIFDTSDASKPVSSWINDEKFWQFSIWSWSCRLSWISLFKFSWTTRCSSADKWS